MKAFKEKLKLKKAGQKVMKNAAQSLLDDLGGVDTDALTDEEIDELLVGLSDSGLTGTRPGKVPPFLLTLIPCLKAGGDIL